MHKKTEPASHDTSSSQDGIGLPLDGVRILDLSQGIAGPSCASILAREGAEVIKVEPLAGDWGRLMGGGEQGMTALSVASNLGKRSLSVDATKPRGCDIVRKLADRADVLIESFRPGVMERLGLGYETVSARCPRLIYVSVTGFGSSGPYRALPATDSVLQAISGMMVMNRGADDVPRRVSMYIIDATTGIYAAQAVTAALLARERGSAARRIEVSLINAAAALQSIGILDDAMFPGVVRPPAAVPSGTFQTRDGQINLAALRDNMFEGLARALGKAEWPQMAEYQTNQARARNAERLHREIAEVLKHHDSEYWLARLRAADVLCAPVLDYQAFQAHEQAIEQQVFEQLKQPGVGSLPIPRLPGVPEQRTPPTPFLGEHTAEILAELGYTREEIVALEHDKIVLDHGSVMTRPALQT